MTDPADTLPPDQGEGNVNMIIKAEGGKVIMRYPRPMLWVAFDPSNAVQVAKHIIDCAADCGANVEIKVPRREISREKRGSLIFRAMHVQRSMAEKGRAPKDIAQHVVDSVLAAID